MLVVGLDATSPIPTTVATATAASATALSERHGSGKDDAPVLGIAPPRATPP
jgi:hypothetical protein